jgi:hypothetical protein
MKPSSVLVDSFDLYFFLKILFSNRIQKVFVLDSADFFDSNTSRVGTYESLLKKWRPNLVFVRMPNYLRSNKQKLVTDSCWISNQLTLDYLESDAFHKIAKAWVPRFIPKDEIPGFTVCLKKSLMPIVFRKLLFLEQEASIGKELGNNFFAFVSEPDFLGLTNFYYSKVGFLSSAETSIWSLVSDKIVALSFLITTPFQIRDLFRRGITLKPVVQSFGFGSQVIWGLSPEDFQRDRNFLGDAEIQKRGDIAPSEIIYTAGKPFGKKITRTFIQVQKEIAINHGATLVDETRLKIPVRLFFESYLVRGFLSLLFTFAFRLGQRPFTSPLIRIVQRIHQSMISHEVFCAHYRVKVFFSRDDYDFDHVTRTLIQRRIGGLNHGLQHSALQEPAIIPFMAYPYFDTYYVTGPGFLNLWKPFWGTNAKHVVVGNRTDTQIVEAMSSATRKKEFLDKYGSGRKILVLISPPDANISPPELLRARYHGLEALTSISPNTKVILRPRSSRAIDSWVQIFPEIIPRLEDGSIAFEWGDFSTHELMAFSDVLVAEDASSTILEAIHFKHIFVTSINARYPASSLLKGLSCENMAQLVRLLIEQWLTGKFSEERIRNVERLRRDYTLAPYGDCWRRIASNIRQEIKANQ